MRPPTAARPRTRRKGAPTAPRAPTIGTVPIRGSARPHPELGLGLWALGRWTREDEARTKATLGRALERGVPWFDTAEVYGNGRSERVLGEVLHRARPSVTPFLTTKVSWEHLRPAQVRASLVGSLERLGRTSVDLYLIHAPDPRVPLTDTMPVLEALWKEKKVGAIGVSNFGREELEQAKEALSEAPIAVNQVRYNLFDRADADPIREYCRAEGILIEAYTPLGRGLLTGRYLDTKRVPEGVRRFARSVVEPDRFPAIQARARELRTLAAEANVPLASLALHWVRRQGAVPIFGASRPDQVDSNLAAWAARPADDVLARADAIARGDGA